MENNVMFIGNLITDQHKPQLAESIFNLFKHCLNFEYIKKKDIEVKGKSKKCKFAFITLRSEDDYNEAYYKLGSFESRKQLGFNFLKLVDPSKQLIVDRKRPPKIVKNSPPKSKNSQPVASVEERKNSPPKSKNSQPVASVEERKNNLQNIMNYQPVITGEEKKNSPSNIKNTQPVVCVDERKNIPLKIRNQQSAVSVDLQAGEQYNDSVKQKQKFYREGELLGNETRNTEFKEGSGEHFIKKNLKDIVSRYMSGFLNSSQQGTLFIGVKDDGSVVGIRCDQQKEDDIRLRIDQVIKTIKPAIFPNNYHVWFIPVYKDGQAKANCKVLEITVDIVSMGTPEQLYEVSGEVYMRLEGSLHGPLKPSEIQEWTKQVHQKELKRKLLELEAKKKSKVCVLI